MLYNTLWSIKLLYAMEVQKQHANPFSRQCDLSWKLFLYFTTNATPTTILKPALIHSEEQMLQQLYIQNKTL